MSPEDGKTKETVESENSQIIFHGAKPLKAVAYDQGCSANGQDPARIENGRFFIL
tara:strand:- start:404 stop:568 length:165 start_codon:yes stop_codon:yes gene_type:complete